MNINVHDILYVATIVKEKSFSKAANKLFITQPALSQTIQRLESKLGLKLFIRKNNTIYATPACEEFIQNGEHILKLTAQLEQKMDAIKVINENYLRIGSSPFFSGVQLSKIISHFQTYYPTIKIDIIEKLSPELEDMVLHNELELCLVPISVGQALHTQLNYIKMPPERIVLAVPHNHPLNAQLRPSYATDKQFPFVDLRMVKDDPFVFLKMKRFRRTEIKLCEDLGHFKPNIAYLVTSYTTLSSFILDGIAVGFLPEVFAERLSEKYKPIIYHINSPNAVHSFTIAFKKKNHLSDVALQFIDVAKSLS